MVLLLLYYGETRLLLRSKTLLEDSLLIQIQTAVAATELTSGTWAFWAQTGHVYALENPRDVNAKTGRLREALSNKLTWIFAGFIFGYVGAEGNFNSIYSALPKY